MFFELLFLHYSSVGTMHLMMKIQNSDYCALHKSANQMDIDGYNVLAKKNDVSVQLRS